VCTPPVSDPCADGANTNVTDTTNNTTACTPPVSDPCADGANTNVTGTANIDCPLVQPTVVIKSATDELGNSLSPNDIIAPQKVTFTFTAEANETSQAFEEEGPQDYQFQCALDHESFSSCNSPMTYTMEKGKHNFVVRLGP
jgi:hypothetical protein